MGVKYFAERSLTLREERRLRVFENRVLRRIFGPKRDEVTGDGKKLHNEELRNLYSSPNIIKMIKLRRVAATCSRWFLARGVFYPEDGSYSFLRNVGSHKICMAPRRHSSVLF
jgi:hypothetical protein